MVAMKHSNKDENEREKRCTSDAERCACARVMQTLNEEFNMWSERPSGLYSLRQVTDVKLDRVRSISRWVASEA